MAMPCRPRANNAPTWSTTMIDINDNESQDIPTPDPALERLSELVGTWRLAGRPVGSDRDTISGTTTFRWLDGTADKSFYLLQDMEMDYDGQLIKSHELIGYNAKTGAFASLVFSNMAPDPWPYEWDIKGDDIRISIRKDAMDATFTGRFSPDMKQFSGGWRPNPGADEIVNAPYDLVATRVG
jgi:hypothetical protein